MRSRPSTALLAATALTLSVAAPLIATSPATAQDQAVAPAPVLPVAEPAFRRASDHVLALAEAAVAQPGSSPAMAVVMVRRGGPPVIWTHGRLSADPTSAPVDADTPFYVASQTKAFVGLMAVALDARGVFDLDWTLADVWPDLVLPDGADPRAITFRQLLSHQAPLVNDALGFRTAYADRVPAADYGRLLAEGSEAREPGFRYANLGYLLYGAALELKTGRDWRDWLDETVLAPLGMSRSGARAERLDGLPAYHRWMGDQGWDVLSGKPDDLMHAAGGLVVSPADMARWLDLQLGAPNPALHAEWVAAAQTRQVAALIRGDGVDCQGYALGWNLCRIGQVDVRAHGGSYTGVRSLMAVSPELGVGIAVFSTSDSLTGGLGHSLLGAFFEGVQGLGEPADPQAFGASYGERLARFGLRRMEEVQRRRAEPMWQGWAWRPAPDRLADYAGRYAHPLLGEVVVWAEDGRLRARLGRLDWRLEPAAPDLFGASDGPPDPPDPFGFERADGRVTTLTWDDQRFRRLD